MRLSAMYETTVPVTVDWYGEPVEVKVRPGRLTGDLILASEGARGWDDLVAQVLAVVAEWDVVGDDGERLPVNEATVRMVPALFLGAIVQATVAEIARQGRG